jgi:hypothetical protein
MTKYNERDAARDTRVSEKEATAAHHQARDDSGVRNDEAAGDPSPQNKSDAAAKTGEIISRSRER